MEKIYGIHAVDALIKVRPECIAFIYLLENRHDQRLETLRTFALSNHIAIKELSRNAMNALFNEDVRHQGVIAEVTAIPAYAEHDLEKFMAIKDVVLLILDGVQDPHNLGACLRSANAFGVHAVIAPKDKAVGLTSTVRKVACGAAEFTPFIPVTNLSRTLNQLKEAGIWLIGTEGNAEKQISEIDMTGSIALVVGAEAKGMRRLTREHCDFLAAIPMLGTVESFNVSVATGICLYEVVRQRHA